MPRARAVRAPQLGQTALAMGPPGAACLGQCPCRSGKGPRRTAFRCERSRRCRRTQASAIFATLRNRASGEGDAGSCPGLGGHHDDAVTHQAGRRNRVIYFRVDLCFQQLLSTLCVRPQIKFYPHTRHRPRGRDRPGSIRYPIVRDDGSTCSWTWTCTHTLTRDRRQRFFAAGRACAAARVTPLPRLCPDPLAPTTDTEAAGPDGHFSRRRTISPHIDRLLCASTPLLRWDRQHRRGARSGGALLTP